MGQDDRRLGQGARLLSILGSSLIAASLLMPPEISLQAPCQEGPLCCFPEAPPLEVVSLTFFIGLHLLLPSQLSAVPVQ